MGLADRTWLLTTPEQVDEFIARHSLAVLFKAGNCGQTDETFARLQSTLTSRDDAAFGLIRVVEARAASDHLAERTGVRHESPQLFVFRDGALTLSRSHWDITAEVLAAALGARLAAV
jgi:bacillithiol system protein YtxJ